MVDFCEHGNGLWGSINMASFIGQLSSYQIYHTSWTWLLNL